MSHIYHEQEVWLPCSEALFEWDDAFHSLLLGDRPRMKAYESAIRESVRPGMKVLDLGTGTGILAQWALQAGADIVYGIEMNPQVLDSAKRRLSDAGFGDRFVPVRGMSFDVELPNRVDLIISEIMGNLADNESMVPIIRDARDRFLQENGIIMPRQVVSYLVPVEALNAHAQVHDGRCMTLNDSYSLEKLLGDRNSRSRFDMYYDVIIAPRSYLSEPQEVRRYGGAWDQDDCYEQRMDYRFHRDGSLTGLKGYFIARLSETSVLDISSADIDDGRSSDSWKHAFLPVASPIAVRAGDKLELMLRRQVQDTDRSMLRQSYQWSGRILRGSDIVGEFNQST